MIKIWERVHQIHPDWTLDFYGEGEEKDKYAPLIESLNINFVIHEPTGNIHKEYCNSSIAILTSISESFALVIPEEMSCGLPVVSFDCPYGPGDIIKDGINGFLIPPNNVDLFVEKLCLLIEDEKLREKMGKAGIEYSRRFSAEIVMPQWKNLFENLLNSVL
jgi:glycosyltransferase involved in cell wall biosynthesis